MVVLDANILIPAALGSKVLLLLGKYSSSVRFLTPATALDEARRHLPALLLKRGVDPSGANRILDQLTELIWLLEPGLYSDFESVARLRLRNRDEEDWPILASALAFNCPIWTEDMDFFGCGVATWTSDRIELYLAEAKP
ncbi:MAG: PIN domain-containing protein [Anaeromyxobacter sp.]